MISYVDRDLASGLHSDLGAEADRYMALASADATTYRSPMSYPMLPMEVLGERESSTPQ